MAFVPKTQAFNAKINAVTIGHRRQGRGPSGGQNVLPFYTFDAPDGQRAEDRRGNFRPRPRMDRSPAGWSSTPAARPWPTMAKKAETMPGADFLRRLHLESADPNGAEPLCRGVRRA